MTAPEARLTELLTRARAGGLSVVLLGIGNPLRGDDAVGHLLAQDLAEAELAGLWAFPVGIAVENATHLAARHGARILLLVDAVSGPERPLGAWDFFEPDALDSFIHSTHSLPLSLLVAHWRRELPGLEIHFLGIGIHGTAAFGALSPEVEATRRALTACFRSALG